MDELEREGAGLGAFDRSGAFAASAGGEQDADPILRLEECDNPTDECRVAILDVQQQGLAAAGDHNVIGGGACLEAGLDQLGGQVDAEGAVTEAVIRYDHDIGRAGETERVEAFEQQADLGVVGADRGARACDEPAPKMCWMWSGSVSQLITTSAFNSVSTYSRSTPWVQATAGSSDAAAPPRAGAGPKRCSTASLTVSGKATRRPGSQ